MSSERRTQPDAVAPLAHAETESSQSLRRRAEDRLSHPDRRERLDLTPDEAAQLLQELRVHQIELEMQNESLRDTQEALERSRARYFDLYELAPVGYVTLAEPGLIEEANLVAALLLETPRGLLIGQPLTHFILPEDQDVFYRSRLCLFTTGKRQTCELRLRRTGGASVWVQLQLAQGMDSVAEARQARITLSDINARKQAEAVLREEDERKDQFLAMLGHELRNPLAPILHVAESLRLAPPRDPQHIRQASEILTRQVGHLTRLVDDLLDVARIGRGVMHLAKAPCDLREAAESAAEQVRPLLAQHGQRLEMTLPDTPVMLEGDPVRLAQVIANLLRNASQFSEAETPVSLTLEVQNGVAVLRVRDRGIGLPQPLLPHLFGPFARGEMSEHAQGGLGMGLALVKGLVELHGGSVEASSPGPGQGSIFGVRLPLSGAAVAVAAPALQLAGPAVRQILVVDDNPDVAEAFALLLDILGQQVETVADGPAALDAAERLRPDLILLDLGLPGMDGIEVARRLRASGCAARLVAVTGYGQEHDLADGKAAGFDEHLLKPVGQDAVIAMLARCPVP